MAHNLTEADLVTYEGAAAGHDGVLSSADGGLVIKPCTEAEIAFYQDCAARNEPLVQYMPRFVGTLALASPAERALAGQAAESGTSGSTTESAAAEPAAAEGGPPNFDGTAATLPSDHPGPLKGKKLDTGRAIVLENAAAGFVRPNIIDLKLGARLWDDGAAEAKRARLDAVAAATTSGSLGFRIAGMRVWQSASKEFKAYDKLYGRQFDADSVREGFSEYFGGGGLPAELQHKAAALVRTQVQGVWDALAVMEVRMYSASILAVVEGDAEALAAGLEAAEKAKENEDEEDEEEDDDDDDDSDTSKPHTPLAARVVMIDFAHAALQAGIGRDENVLRGVSSVLDILDGLVR